MLGGERELLQRDLRVDVDLVSEADDLRVLSWGSLFGGGRSAPLFCASVFCICVLHLCSASVFCICVLHLCSESEF